MSLNVFGCPISCLEQHQQRMKEKSTTNVTEEKFHSCGVWETASYINHSCNCNATRSFIGDMMIVRASRDLPPDTEVVFGYQSDCIDYKERQEKLQQWNFKCDCIICKTYQNTKKNILTRRKTLKADGLDLLKRFERSKASNIEDIIDKLCATYKEPAHEVPRLGTWDFQLFLPMMYFRERQFEKVVDFSLKALESLGFVTEDGIIPRSSIVSLNIKKWGLMTDGVIDCWVILARGYRRVAPDLEAKRTYMHEFRTASALAKTRPLTRFMGQGS
jgi:SET domain